MVSAERLEGIDMPTLKEQGVDWDRRIERIETRPAVVLSLLGLMVAVRRDGCDAVRAQLLAMSAERGA